MPATLVDTPRHAFHAAKESAPRRQRPRLREMWRLRWAWGAAIAIAAVIWTSNVRLSTGPAAGATFQGAAPLPATRPTFRVGIYNIHGGRGSDQVRDLARTADCLRGID
ncbi:MAG: hypothetical protein ABUL64_03990, partial [Singulisphaera sp.]